MQNIKQLSKNTNYTTIDIGTLDDIKSNSFIHPKLKKEVHGKLFLKELTNATGTEISYTTIPPKSVLGYFHIHNKDEETYIILKGKGYFQVDDDCFDICEGSVIRVAPKGVRGISNSSDDEMVYLCIQSKINSLEEHTSDDGTRVQHNSKLKID
jgi:quercetin dioxygenase-like cupin family protein